MKNQSLVVIERLGFLVDDGNPTKAIKQMAALESSSDPMPNVEESRTKLKISIKLSDRQQVAHF